MFVRCTCCTALVWIAGMLPVHGQQPAPEAPPALGKITLEEEQPELGKNALQGWPPISVLAAYEGHAPAPSTLPPPSVDGPAVFSDRDAVFTHRNYWPEVWGFTGIDVFATGNKMAPNGQTYYPLGSLFADINVGFIPQKRLYIFAQCAFWAQKPSSGVTNGDQGNFDFSKRQLDLTLGAAWRYYGPLEARVFAFSNNNLNRGFDLNVPEGYNDGVGIENRYYIFKSNAYDLPRLNFLSLGYMPSKEITGEDGLYFKPGLFARAYLTYEFVPLKYYVYADTQLICQSVANPRLLYFDDGFAARPFNKFNGMEFRLGVNNTVDVQVDITRTLVYALFQVIF
jgi:hypothetical protein